MAIDCSELYFLDIQELHVRATLHIGLADSQEELRYASRYGIIWPDSPLTNCSRVPGPGLVKFFPTTSGFWESVLLMGERVHAREENLIRFKCERHGQLDVPHHHRHQRRISR